MPMMMPMGGSSDPEDGQKQHFLDWLRAAYPNSNFPSAARNKVRGWAKEYCASIGYADWEQLAERAWDWRNAEGYHGQHRANPFAEDGPGIVQIMEFVNWLPTTHVGFDPLKLDATQVDSLAAEFCTVKNYPDTAVFASAVKQWQQSAVAQSSVDAAAIARYNKVPYHGMFIFLAAGNFPDFIKKYRTDLDALTGDWIDVYYSLEDLDKASSGYAVIDQLRSLEVDETLLPALLIWGKLLTDSSVIPLLKLGIDDIFALMPIIVRGIRKGKDLAAISAEVMTKVEAITKASLPSVNINVGDVNNAGNVIIGVGNTQMANTTASAAATNVGTATKPGT